MWEELTFYGGRYGNWNSHRNWIFVVTAVMTAVIVKTSIDFRSDFVLGCCKFLQHVTGWRFCWNDELRSAIR